MNNLTAKLQPIQSDGGRVTRIKEYTIADRGGVQTPTGSSSHLYSQQGFKFSDDWSKFLETKKAANPPERTWQYSATLPTTPYQESAREAPGKPATLTLHSFEKKPQAYGSLTPTTQVVRSTLVPSKLTLTPGPTSYSSRFEPTDRMAESLVVNPSSSLVTQSSKQLNGSGQSDQATLAGRLSLLNSNSTLRNTTTTVRLSHQRGDDLQVRVLSRSKERTGNFESFRLANADENQDINRSMPARNQASINNYGAKPVFQSSIHLSKQIDSSATSPPPRVLEPKPVKLSPVTSMGPGSLRPEPLQQSTIKQVAQSTPPQVLSAQPRSLHEFAKIMSSTESKPWKFSPRIEPVEVKIEPARPVQPSPLVQSAPDKYQSTRALEPARMVNTIQPYRLGEPLGKQSNVNFYESIRPNMTRVEPTERSVVSFSQTSAPWRTNGSTPQSEYTSTRQLSSGSKTTATFASATGFSFEPKRETVPVYSSTKSYLGGETSAQKPLPTMARSTEPNLNYSTVKRDVSPIANSLRAHMPFTELKTSIDVLLPPSSPTQSQLPTQAPAQPPSPPQPPSPTLLQAQSPTPPVTRSPLHESVTVQTSPVIQKPSKVVVQSQPLARKPLDRDYSAPRVVQSLVFDQAGIQTSLNFRKNAAPSATGNFKFYSTNNLDLTLEKSPMSSSAVQFTSSPRPALVQNGTPLRAPESERMVTPTKAGTLRNDRSPVPQASPVFSPLRIETPAPADPLPAPENVSPTNAEDLKNLSKKPILKKSGSRCRCDSLVGKVVKIDETQNDCHEFERYNFNGYRRNRQGSYFEKLEREEEARIRAEIAKVKQEKADGIE